VSPVWVNESELQFGPFDVNDIFEPERSPGIAALGKGISKVEFILHSKNKAAHIVTLLEAKSTIPRETDVFFADIKTKMLHSLTVWALAIAGRQNAIYHELPQQLKRSSDLKHTLQLILVIPPMPDHALVGATEKFRKMMQPEIRLWSIPEQYVRVLNTKRVQAMGLVQ